MPNRTIFETLYEKIGILVEAFAICTRTWTFYSWLWPLSNILEIGIGLHECSASRGLLSKGSLQDLPIPFLKDHTSYFSKSGPRNSRWPIYRHNRKRFRTSIYPIMLRILPFHWRSDRLKTVQKDLFTSMVSINLRSIRWSVLPSLMDFVLVAAINIRVLIQILKLCAAWRLSITPNMTRVK